MSGTSALYGNIGRSCPYCGYGCFEYKGDVETINFEWDGTGRAWIYPTCGQCHKTFRKQVEFTYSVTNGYIEKLQSEGEN